MRGTVSLAGDDFGQVRQAMEMPTPRVPLGLALRGLAHSAIDVSDGLLGDLMHVLTASGKGATLQADALPRSDVLRRQAPSVQQTCTLQGGDDYELLFSAAATQADAVSASRRAGRRAGDSDRRRRRRTRPAGDRCRRPTAAVRRARVRPFRSMTRPTFAFMRRHPAHWLALGFGSGLAPRAPGTVGTLWAWAAYLVLDRWVVGTDAQWAGLLVVGLVVGLWACTVTAQHMQVADPGAIVWDEVLGFWLVLVVLMPAGLLMQLLAFALFRYFDAAKPGPVAWADRRFKLSPGGAIGWRQGLRHPVGRPGGGVLHAAGLRAGGGGMELSAFEPAVRRLADALRARGWRLAAAESCTGGLIAAACTQLAGSSDWFERGFVTYSNQAKTDLLGVPPELLACHGAVSEEVVRAMALGARARAPVTLTVAVTGIAGPSGAVPGKPVGTVWLAWAGPTGVDVERLQLPGDRSAVRSQTVAQALARLTAAARAPLSGG